MSRWREIECSITEPRRLRDPFEDLLQLQAGQLVGRMCVAPLVIAGVLTPDSAVCRIQTVFRTAGGALWMHSMAAGLINLWFPEGTVIHEPYFREEYDAVLEGLLDTRSDYEFKTDVGELVRGYLKYSGIKAFITIERNSLAIDLEWLVLERGMDGNPRLVRYGHRITHEQWAFQESFRKFSEHRNVKGEPIITDIVRLRALPPDCPDVPRSTIILEPGI